MPNWVTTDVTVYANSIIELEYFIIQATEGYIIKGGNLETAKKNNLNLITEKNERFHKDYFSFGAITGVPEDYAHNWYNRGIEIWGTKWDVNGEISKGYLMDQLELSRTLTIGPPYAISFEMPTAWSFPTEAWTTIAKEYPNLIFTFRAIEEGNFFIAAGAVNNEDFELVFQDPDKFWEKVCNEHELDRDENYDDAIPLVEDEIYTWLDNIESLCYQTVYHRKNKTMRIYEGERKELA